MANTEEGFNQDLIKKYPRSNRRLQLDVSPYTIELGEPEEKVEETLKLETGTTVHISPYGVQFRSTEAYEKGSLLKIHLSIPDYWARKQRYVDYGRIDTPERCKILVKVVETEDIGKRGKKKMVLCRTVNMDEVDEQVLKTFLQEG